MCVEVIVCYIIVVFLRHGVVSLFFFLFLFSSLGVTLLCRAGYMIDFATHF